MKIKNFINLCNLAKKILVKYKKSNYILAIRQLYLMRPHPVLLKEYYKSEEKIDKNVDGKNFLLRIYNLFKEYLSDTNDIYSIHPIKRYAKKNDRCLFLSHLINEKHIRNSDDFYYGKLPKYLEKKKFNSLTILRNLTNQNSKLIFYNNKNFFKNKILLSKSLSFIEELKLITGIFITYIFLIKLKNTDTNVKKFLNNKNTFKFAGTVYNNLKLLAQVEKIVKIYKPNYFFLTCEGHAWEKIIIKEIKKKFPNIKFFAYQFSIITKYSSSIYLDLGTEFFPNFILTSGNYTKKIFTRKKNYESFCLNIGSNKFLRKKKFNKKSKNVLILPEGFNSETVKMMNFTLKAAIKFKNKKFIFRFHPMINKENFIKEYFNDQIKFPKNLIISNNRFEEDLNNSKYVIYRGSAASIQALAANKVVIYLNISGEINIDPLYMLKKKIYVKNINELQNVFEDKKIINKNITNVKFTKEYFDKPNFNNLIKFLK